jgi:preprotein translocase subunit SecE
MNFGPAGAPKRGCLPGVVVGESAVFLCESPELKGQDEMAKTSPGEFVRQVRAETAKVSWPSRREVMQTTILVLIMTSILAVFFLGVDQVLGRGVRFLLGLGA